MQKLFSASAHCQNEAEGLRRIARETVRRYVQKPAVAAGFQTRPKGRRLDAAAEARATALWAQEAAGNAVVVWRLRAAVGVAEAVDDLTYQT